ncbi:MAG TPA: UvrD-helicase domain-containing protein [Polyangiaceae bacterium]|nr:UvrD-helicase domain-containing protein [Polyangiaceae bacterium]
MGAPVSELNPAQREAVTTLSGPLLVLAGAGTGKTRVITYRIAQLVRHGTPPHRILAVTFTNKAAREMRERALRLLGRRPRGAKPPEISTFHSLCVRILRRHATRLGYPAEFSIYDRGDQEMLARLVLRDIRVSDSTLRPGELLGFIGGWKNQNVSPEEARLTADGNRAELAAQAYARYEAQLRAGGSMDFDDLLLQTTRLFREHPEARFAEASRFDHLLIDEYQDTNRLQYEIVKVLAHRHRNLCVVGDDDQSIYGWRGAEVEHILSFQNDWPDAHVVRLEANYRSRAPILELANKLILHNSARHQKVLRPSREGGVPPRILRMEDENMEAEHVVREIRQLLVGDAERRVSPSDIAILFRTNEQPRAFELELRREKIPYVLVGGLSFYDRREIKDVLAYLRVLANPLDEVSLLRVINTPPRGIGPSTVETLLEHAVSQGRPLWTVLPEAASLSLSEAVVSRIQGFQKLLDGFRAKLGTLPIADIVRALLGAVEYRAELDRVYTGPGEAESRWLAIEELVNAAALYEQRAEAPSLLGFLEEAALADRDDKDEESGRERHAVTLMTLHSAKGLEFPHVYMVGVEEGILPHQRSVLEGRGVEEERRLCYVGVTRAQETLTLTFTKARMKWGKPRPSIPSRFLMEMRGETERARRAAEAAMALFGSAVQGRPRGSGTESETEGAGKRSTKASRKTRDTKRKRSASG